MGGAGEGGTSAGGGSGGGRGAAGGGNDSRSLGGAVLSAVCPPRGPGLRKGRTPSGLLGWGAREEGS